MKTDASNNIMLDMGFLLRSSLTEFIFRTNRNRNALLKKAPN